MWGEMLLDPGAWSVRSGRARPVVVSRYAQCACRAVRKCPTLKAYALAALEEGCPAMLPGFGSVLFLSGPLLASMSLIHLAANVLSPSLPLAVTFPGSLFILFLSCLCWPHHPQHRGNSTTGKEVMFRSRQETPSGVIQSERWRQIERGGKNT